MCSSRTSSLCLLVLPVALVMMLPVTGCSQQASDTPFQVTLVPNDAEQRVDILVDGELFTSYLYSDRIATLKKPILFPIRTSTGKYVTRGYPLAPRAAERADHQHHTGFWFNYGEVNGLDFWGHSAATPPERAGKMGTIRHREIKRMQNGEGKGELEVTMDWLNPGGAPILREHTRFIFHAGPEGRAIDRITTLTALEERVVFNDTKEGMLAIRVTRALEHLTDRPIKLTDADGQVTTVPVLDNKGVTGRYVSSEGVTGIEVWGTRARWMMLSGVVEGDSVTVAIFDHPKNVGYPTYWHARGYGLFAANPLGQKVFSKGKEEMNFVLDPGESTTFRHRLFIHTGAITAEQMEAQYQKFVASREL